MRKPKPATIRVGLANRFEGPRAFVIVGAGRRWPKNGQQAMERDAHAIAGALYDGLPAHTVYRTFAVLRHRLGLCDVLGMKGDALCCADKRDAKGKRGRK